jgi:hypothetical protein
LVACFTSVQVEIPRGRPFFRKQGILKLQFLAFVTNQFLICILLHRGQTFGKKDMIFNGRKTDKDIKGDKDYDKDRYGERGREREKGRKKEKHGEDTGSERTRNREKVSIKTEREIKSERESDKEGV